VLANVLADAHNTCDHTMPHHFALHGNAFNPDTGKIAEYMAPSKEPNTMFFIPVSVIPRDRKATYRMRRLRHAPRKRKPLSRSLDLWWRQN
jgi:hypothetical protein